MPFTIKTPVLFVLIFLGANTTLFANEDHDDIQPLKTRLSALEQNMTDWIDQREEQLIEELRAHVDINSGTENIAGIDQYRSLLEQELKKLGFETRLQSSEAIPILTCEGGEMRFADHLIGSRHTANNSQPNRILLNGHMDTVFSADDEFQSLEIDANGTLHGPGVGDMKGGIVVMLNALRALEAAGQLDNVHLTVLFNSDEEIGSLGSASLIEELAAQHDVGMVFEGSYQNRVTRARKGLGQVRLKVTGRESHAGAAHDQGVSANLELAHQITRIEQLTDYQRHTTVNVGVMGGGEKRNTVPGCADAYIDLRYPTAEDGNNLQQKIEQVTAETHVSNPNYPNLPVVQVWSKLHRPVKPRHDKVDALIAEAMGLSHLLGEPITGTRFSGGGTDGSIAQNAGLPTIDSLGLDAVGAHSSREQTSIQSLMARTKLAAIMISRQIARRP